MVDGEWGYAEPFKVIRKTEESEDSDNTAKNQQELSFSQSSWEVLHYFECRTREPMSLRELTQTSFARRRCLTSQQAMMAALMPLLDAEKITKTEDSEYKLSEPKL
jgi:hypothetical protein